MEKGDERAGNDVYTPMGGHATHFVGRGLEISHGLEPTASSLCAWQKLKKHWEEMSFAAKRSIGMQVMTPLCHPQTGLPNNKGGVANARVYVEELDVRVKDYTGEEPFFSQAG